MELSGSNSTRPPNNLQLVLSTCYVVSASSHKFAYNSMALSDSTSGGIQGGCVRNTVVYDLVVTLIASVGGTHFLVSRLPPLTLSMIILYYLI